MWLYIFILNKNLFMSADVSNLFDIVYKKFNWLLTNIYKKILTYLGYEINKSKLDHIYLNPKEFLPIKESNDNFQIYKKAIKKSKNEWSDNFFKQMSSFSLIQLIRYTLKKMKFMIL